MQEYLFEWPDGSCQVRLMRMEEFKALKGDHPYKRNLYRSMNPVLHCKLETFGECIQGTMKIPRGNKGRVSIQAFGFYLRGNELLLIEDGSLLGPMIGKLESGRYGVYSPSGLLLLLFELLIEDDVLYLGVQEETLSDMEEQLLEHLPADFHETIIRYRKQYQAYHSYYEQLADIGEQMQGDFGWKLTREERTAWQLYANRALRLHDHAELLREDLIQIRELYQSLINVQQNKVMSILTVVTTIFLPLTLIAGWYGMNFPGMPEFRWQYAYPVVILVSVGIVVLEIMFFRKKGML